MDNKILIYLKNNYLKNNKINNFLNAYITECLICFSELDNNSIIMINKFCKCYENCFLCDKCFIKWITPANSSRVVGHSRGLPNAF